MKRKKNYLTKREGVEKLLTMTLGLVMAVATCVTVVPGTEMKAKAAGTGKNLQIGSAVLTPVMTSVEDTSYTPSNTKDRVTTAQMVYYGSSGTQKWLAIGYNGTGAVSISNTATLFAIDNIETGKQYEASGTSNFYVDSDIRKVLIGDSNANGEGGYYSSKFDSVEKTAILGRTLIHGDYNSNIDNLCDGISDLSNYPTDKLWLLSTKEADLLKLDYRKSATNFWWLRSPGDGGDYAAYVLDNGLVDYAGDDVHYYNGVRPAFDLNLQSIIFTSAASGGKSSGAAGPNALQAVGDSASSTEWKLTISDSTRNGFSASRTDSDVLTAGGTAEITYSGAQTGTNEYVSAIITDSSDRVLYYGNIASPASETGTASINIPNDFVAGNKLYVFQEKCNGTTLTDYSSGLINLTAPGSSGVGLVAGTPANTQYSSGEGEENVDDTPEPNYIDALMKMLEKAKEAGGPQTIYWYEGTALPGPVMKFLSENPQITLVFSYTYQGLDYTVFPVRT